MSTKVKVALVSAGIVVGSAIIFAAFRKVNKLITATAPAQIDQTSDKTEEYPTADREG